MWYDFWVAVGIGFEKEFKYGDAWISDDGFGGGGGGVGFFGGGLVGFGFDFGGESRAGGIEFAGQCELAVAGGEGCAFAGDV
jgi:hypothetical protein